MPISVVHIRHYALLLRRRTTSTAGLPAGVKPDALSDEYAVLIKACSALRLTHQIRLAAAAAEAQRKRLLLSVKENCELGATLKAFIDAQWPGRGASIVSLYLCVFVGDTDVAGVDVGGYSDFGEFRDAVQLIEGGNRGSRYPTLMNHSDADGEWSLGQLRALRRELSDLATRDSLNRFRDTEDRPLAAALLALCDDGLRERQPIVFQ